MGIMEWGLPAALLVGILFWCYRKARRGFRTLDDDRRLCREKIAAGEKQLAEDRKNISATEHLAVARAALEDLLRLDGNPEGCSIRADGGKIFLNSPRGVWTVELLMNEKRLRSTRKVARGGGRWLLSGFGHSEHHEDIASLARGLNEHFHSPDWDADPAAHLARRFSGRDAHPDKLSARRPARRRASGSATVRG